MTDVNKMRAEFEMAFQGRFPTAPLDRHPLNNDEYDGVAAAWTWWAWQAATAAAEAQPAGEAVAWVSHACLEWLKDRAKHLDCPIQFQGRTLQLGDYNQPLYTDPPVQPDVEAMRAELAEWHKLKDPNALHINLLREFPAKLGESQLRHIIGDAAEAPPAQVPDGWRDIDSAPKSGRTILLGYFNSHGNWRTMRGQWFTKEYIDDNWEDGDLFAAGWYETSVEADDAPSCWPTTPTHWMLAPTAPQPKESI